MEIHRKSAIQSQLPPVFCLLLSACCLLPTVHCLPLWAQARPYASIDRTAVTYHGPGRDAAHDLPGPEIRLGLLAPLSGPRQAEGEVLRHAAEMAVEEANALRFPGGRPLVLVTRDATGPWGQASSQIVRMVFDDQVVAILTFSEGDSAHLAEQVGNRIGVPVLTLSTESTTTETNLPWIFRLPPADATQAAVLARDIYQIRKLQRVVLFTQDDRDGRLGGEAFLRAARELGASVPDRMVVDPATIRPETIGKAVAAEQCAVIWTDAPTARLLAARLREWQPGLTLYLCHKAAALAAGGRPEQPQNGNASTLKAAAEENPQGWARFCQGYERRYAAQPGTGAAEAYDGVRLLAASLGHSGPNRARLRDALAEVVAFPGASGVISFDHAGNNISPVTLLNVQFGR